jgi:hypothetical protein
MKFLYMSFFVNSVSFVVNQQSTNSSKSGIERIGFTKTVTGRAGAATGRAFT